MWRCLLRGVGLSTANQARVTVLGLDVSAAQGSLSGANWAAIAKDKRFVYVETRLGNDQDATGFPDYVHGARAAGITVGAYLFAYVLPDDPQHPGRSPEDQAQAFYEAATGLGGAWGELSPAIDLEWPAPEDWASWGVSVAMAQDWCGRCAAKVLALFGRPPMLYTYTWWAQQAKLPSALAGYPLWLAAYGSRYSVPAPWVQATMLQTSDGGYRLPNGCVADEDAISEAAFATLTGR